MTDFAPGVPIEIAEHILRVVAPNAGPMTGPGTNTYVLGREELAVIDPGPLMPVHGEALLQLPGTIRWIFVTHTHRDHSPMATWLADHTGAKLLGMEAPEHGPQDRTFRAEQTLRDGDQVQLDGCTLQAVHTPGHASNHLCYWIADTGWLFTGDHIMGGSTVVIAPPDGNMIDYLQSLERLKALSLKRLAPGHGDVIEAPNMAIDALIRHRLKRESKVAAKLKLVGSSSADELVTHVYDDVPSQLHAVAKMSLLAHLEKLQIEGRARESRGRWTLLSV